MSRHMTPTERDLFLILIATSALHEVRTRTDLTNWLDENTRHLDGDEVVVQAITTEWRLCRPGGNSVIASKIRISRCLKRYGIRVASDLE